VCGTTALGSSEILASVAYPTPYKPISHPLFSSGRLTSVSLCTLHLMVTHFDATLGMGGWLDLTQQGLSPCKKYKTSWRSSDKNYQIIDMLYLPYLSNLKLKY